MALACAVALLLPAGCGDGAQASADAGGDAVPLPDARPTEDAAPVSPQACTVEFQPCEGHREICEQMGLDCVAVSSEVASTEVCLRRCAATADCPVSSYCVPGTSQDDPYHIEFGGLYLAAHHCFPSICGQGYHNGDLFGFCQVGGEDLVVLSEDDKRPGTCIPLDSEGGIGVCIESGEGGGGCTLDPAAAGCPSRGDFVACGPGMLCAGLAGEAYGSCYALCDPRAADPTSTSTCTLMPESPARWCEDVSVVSRGGSGRLVTGYVGLCTPSPGCTLFGADCDDGEGCLPTTMATTSGVCAPAEGGTGACATDVGCAPGWLCVTAEGDGAGQCRRLCEQGDGGIGCEPGASCEGVALDPRRPDVVSQPWGVCVDADGGVADAGVLDAE